MFKSPATSLVASLAALSFLLPGFVPPAGAGIVTTELAQALQERNARIDRIDAVIARASVERQLVRLGVDPDHARQRVRQLGDQELRYLEQRMVSLPAGAGALELLGAVLLVLLVLELLGVTDVFKAL